MMGYEVLQIDDAERNSLQIEIKDTVIVIRCWSKNAGDLPEAGRAVFLTHDEALKVEEALDLARSIL